MKNFKITENEKSRIIGLYEQTAVGTVANSAEILYNAAVLVIKSFPYNILGILMMDLLMGNKDGVIGALNKYKANLGSSYDVLVNAVTKGDLSKLYDSLAKAAKSGLGNK